MQLADPVPPPERRAPVSVELLVRLTVVPWCRTETGGGTAVALLDFGTAGDTVAPITSTLDQEADKGLTLRCSSREVAPLISLDGGAHLFAGQRQLTNGRIRVGYDLYRDPARSAPWRPGIGYPLPVQSVDRAERIGIYGVVPYPAQATEPGTYTDAVHVTVTY